MVYKSSSLAATSGGGSASGITSINSDTTAAQIITAGTGISISTITGTTTITDISQASVRGVGGLSGGGTITSSAAITLGMATNIANTLAGFNSNGVFSDVSIGSNLSLSSGVLNGTVGPAPVTSVFGRTGAVTVNWNDYQFNLIGGTATASQGGTGLATLTAHAVMLGEGVANVSFATIGTAGRLLIDQGAGTDPLFKSMSGDISLTSTGASSIISSVALTGNPTATTQAAGDSSTKIATDAFVTTAVNNAIAGVNPAVAVQYATTAAGDTSALTYSNGVSGVGATLTGANNATTSMDGHTFVVGDVGVTRVLIKNDTQSPSGAFNGVYLFTSLHTSITGDVFTRALDYDMPSDINNTGAIPVINGTVNAQTSWVETATVNTVGTDPLSFTKFTINPTTIITNSTTAGGSLAGTYPNPTIAIGAISGGTSISITNSGSVTGISYSGAASGVSSVSNTDGGTLTITPQTGAVTAGLNLAHANSWTATQTSGVSGGVTSFISAGDLEFAIFANGNSGAGTPTLKWENGNIQTVTITGACTLGFTNPTHPTRLTVISTMSATSNFSYTYAGTVLWPSGTIPTLSSVTNAIDITSFIFDGTSIYGIANTGFAI